MDEDATVRELYSEEILATLNLEPNHRKPIQQIRNKPTTKHYDMTAGCTTCCATSLQEIPVVEFGLVMWTVVLR